MGLKFDASGNLYVTDAYYGIFKLDLKTGEKILLIPANQPIDGKKPKLFNSIALTKSGDIYKSDSTSEFVFEDMLYDMLADPSGRLVFYNSTSKENIVLIDKLSFANGVLLPEDEEFVTVSETGRNKIHRFYLKGPKEGTRDIFIDGLPGSPDNIQSDGHGGFLVALYMAADEDHPSLLQLLGDYPLVRKVLAKLMGLVELIFVTMDNIYPLETFQRVIHFIGHVRPTAFIAPYRATVLHISRDGEILDSLHNLNGHVSLLSEAYIFKDMLYLGTPVNDFIARIPLSEVGWSHLEKKDVVVEIEAEK